jgi:hypothetical protein
MGRWGHLLKAPGQENKLPHPRKKYFFHTSSDYATTRFCFFRKSGHRDALQQLKR